MSKQRQKGFMVRQGDVLVVRVDLLPEGLTPLTKTDPRGLVLAEGEATGHAHTIAWAGIAVAGTDGASDGLYFRVSEDTSLRHQEHDAIALPPGNYRAIRQCEYTPEEIRNVAD